VKIVLAAVVGLLALVTPRLVNHLPDLSGLPAYRVTSDSIVLNTPPRWVPPDLADQVFESCGLSNSESLQDPTLSERIAAAFHTHPWVARVVSVRKSFPSRIQVELEYREPVAMVKGVDGFYPIDCRGVLLPASDFSGADVERFPLIEGVASVPNGRLGEPWGDPAVSGAAELAQFLNRAMPGSESRWKFLNLAAIQVPRHVALNENDAALEYQLRTQGGSRILWGHAPSASLPHEVSAESRALRLADFHRDFGGFDDEHGPYEIDVRPWDGVGRSTIARDARHSRLR
jgi:hypothetical protein